MGETIELERKGDKSLVMWSKGLSREFVVCTYYDGSKPVGSQWSWGHYFNNIIDAAMYFNENA